MSRFYGIISILVIIGSIIEIESTSELRFVSVVFRHGDRTPTNIAKYINDPHVNETFEPIGQGGLTNEGKRREFAIGEELRRRYGSFLGEIYYPRDVFARSTDTARTKMSLALVLAALYPPAPSQRWHPDLNWQPIPTTYEKKRSDYLLDPAQCPRYMEEMRRVMFSPEVLEKMEEYRDLMANLTTLTGAPINNAMHMWSLYHNLAAEQAAGLILPEWTKPLFPSGRLLNATILTYKIFSYNDMLKKLSGGIQLRRISNDMLATTRNAPREARKINLFSCHETTIAGLLHALGVFDNRVPEFSSAIFVELIRRNDTHFVKVLHYLGIPPTVETLTIPGCQELCPLNDFVRLLEKVTATDEDLVCKQQPAREATIAPKIEETTHHQQPAVIINSS